MITRDDVVWAYKELLGREPESDASIDGHLSHDSVGDLVKAFIKTDEFKIKNPDMAVSRESVIWAYKAFLGREPESEDVIVRNLNFSDLGDMVKGFVSTDEFRMKNPEIFNMDNQWVIFSSPRGFRLWVNTADVAVSWQVMKGVYEVDEVQFLERQIKSGQTVVDIGANIGYLTHIMAQGVGPEGRVISFEPHPVLFQHLRKSVWENRFFQCDVHNVAIGEADRTGKLVFGFAGANFGGIQLLPDSDDTSQMSTVDVPIRRLSDMVDPGTKVDFMKVDVEGNEPLVMAGARDLIRAQKPVILSEILGQELHRMHGLSGMEYVRSVCEMGYVCHLLAPGGEIGAEFSDPGMIDFANVVFLPKD